MLQMDIYGMTDVGILRSRNEDQFLVATLSKTLEISHTSLDVGEETRLFGNSQGRLLLVADGMGGHAAGDRASTVVVSAFADYVLNMLRWYFRADPSRDTELAADLREAVLRCQRSIRTEISAHPEEQGMGATLTLAYVIWPRMFVVHVGDSRCYLLRNGQLAQLTRDHTVAQLLCDEARVAGKPVAATIPESQWHHILWNAVGGSEEEPQPDIFRFDLESGDRLLLCTDGLSKHLPDDEILCRLQRDQRAMETCRQLIEDANTAGGSDNITAIVAHFPKVMLATQDASTEATSVPAVAAALADTSPNDFSLDALVE